MYKLCFLTMFISCAGAIPSMAIPNLVYNSPQSSELSKQVQNALPAFNADVRGSIISSGQFKVVTMPNQNQIWNGNSQTVLNYVELYNAGAPKTPVQAVAASQTVKGPKIALKTMPKGTMPDYILLGKVSSITQNEDSTPIKYTNNQTNQYIVSITVDYSLIKTSDDSVMASFTATGSASDVKILSTDSVSQSQSHNIPLLIKTASKNLGSDVITQLNTQFATSSENYDNGSKVITDVKIYKDE